MKIKHQEDYSKLSRILLIPRIYDEGILEFAEAEKHIPFPIKRIYLIHDVIKNAVRGKHTHKKTEQVIFCLQGSITIILDNGKEKEAITLNRSNEGLLLAPMMWHEMVAFKKNTILLVVASDLFDEDDYIRNYSEFLKRTKNDKNE